MTGKMQCVMCGSVSEQLFLMDTEVPCRLYHCENWECRLLEVPNQKDACRAVIYDERSKTYRFCKRTGACKTHASLNSVDRVELKQHVITETPNRAQRRVREVAELMESLQLR